MSHPDKPKDAPLLGGREMAGGHQKGGYPLPWQKHANACAPTMDFGVGNIFVQLFLVCQGVGCRVDAAKTRSEGGKQ